MSDYLANIPSSNRSERAIPPSYLPPSLQIVLFQLAQSKLTCSLWIETMCSHTRTACILLLDNGVFTPSSSGLSNLHYKRGDPYVYSRSMMLWESPHMPLVRYERRPCLCRVRCTCLSLFNIRQKTDSWWRSLKVTAPR